MWQIEGVLSYYTHSETGDHRKHNENKTSAKRTKLLVMQMNKILQLKKIQY